MKRIAKLCILPVILSQTVHAGTQGDYEIKSGLGVAIDWATYAGDDFTIQATYNTHKFTGAIGGNYERNRFANTGGNSNWFEWRGHLGLRHQLESKLFLTVGATGAYSTNTNDPYEVGPYVGGDYYLTRQAFISFKILPYAKEKLWNGNTANTFFEQGSIALNYTF